MAYLHTSANNDYNSSDNIMYSIAFGLQCMIDMALQGLLEWTYFVLSSMYVGLTIDSNWCLCPSGYV